MQTYIVRRLLLMIPTLFMVTVIVFSTVRFIPGDIVDVMMAQMSEMSGKSASEFREEFERKMGLDLPIPIQYAWWIGDIVTRGDLGTSIRSEQSVWDDFILPKIPVTLELILIATLFSLITALPIGVYSVIRQDTLSD